MNRTNAIPKTTETAIRSSVGAMCVPLGIPQPNIDAGLAALFKELVGDGPTKLLDLPKGRCSAERAAVLLGVNRRTLANYAKRGLLTAIYTGANGQRARGYTGESVAALLEGKAKVAAA